MSNNDSYLTEDYAVERGQNVTVQVTVGDYELEEQYTSLLEPLPQQQQQQQRPHDEITLQEGDMLCLVAKPRKVLATKGRTTVASAPNRMVRVQVRKPR